MAHSLSAKKRMRQNAKRRLINRSRSSSLKTLLRGSREALSAGDAGKAEPAVKKAVALLDREANKGLIHPNAAARRKSRMARKLNAIKAKGGK